MSMNLEINETPIVISAVDEMLKLLGKEIYCTKCKKRLYMADSDTLLSYMDSQYSWTCVVDDQFGSHSPSLRPAHPGKVELDEHKG